MLRDSESEKVFQVSGFSMAPTLRGRNTLMQCSRCLVRDRYALLQQAARPPVDRDSTSEACPHCGGKLRKLGIESLGDRVRRVFDTQASDAGSPFSRGDVVAIRTAGKLKTTRGRNRIKRIVAVPGDEVSIRGIEIRINSKSVHALWNDRVLDIPPCHVWVHRPSEEIESRWQRSGDWIRYEHRNVYRGSVPAPILDDYPVNRGLSRTMFPVPGVISVSGNRSEAKTIEVAFRVDGGKVLSCRVTEPKDSADSQRFVIRSDQASLPCDAPLDPSHPIAYRCLDKNIELRDLEVRREIYYRIRPQDPTTTYPIRLGKGQYFVLGDNVPVSVDSRDFGPVNESEILCRLSKIPRKQ